MMIMTMFMMSMNDHSNEDDVDKKKASYPRIGESVRAAMRKALD